MARHIAALVPPACAIAAIAALPANASPQTDFNAVYGDWKKDLVIRKCAWSQAQLQNAYNVANSNPDFQYETRFSDAVQTEIKRWRDGGCAGIAPLATRRKSPLYGAHIIKVRGRGGAAREFVQIRNRAKRTLSFRRALLANFRGRGYVFPARFRLARGRTATVHIGCAKGKRRASFRARTVWLCSRRQLFNDRGDLARLTDAKRLVVSQRGYGSQRSRPVF
jgi:hypothetical protein